MMDEYYFQGGYGNPVTQVVKQYAIFECIDVLVKAYCAEMHRDLPKNINCR